MVHTWIPGNQAGAAFPLGGPAQVFLGRVRACWGVGPFSWFMGQSGKGTEKCHRQRPVTVTTANRAPDPPGRRKQPSWVTVHEHGPGQYHSLLTAPEVPSWRTECWPRGREGAFHVAPGRAPGLWRERRQDFCGLCGQPNPAATGSMVPTEYWRSRTA